MIIECWSINLLNQQDNKYIWKIGRKQVEIKFIFFLKRQFTAKVNLFWFPLLSL